MTDMVSPEEEFFAAAERLAVLVLEFETLPYPRLRDRAADLLQTVDTLHRAPLVRLVAILREQGTDGLLDQLGGDPLVRQLLHLYDLIPGDERTQVEAVLHPFWPYLQAHGGNLEVISVSDGTVRLRLDGACLGCSNSGTSLRASLEETLRREFPAFKSLRIEEVAPLAGDGDGDGPTRAGCSRCP